MNKDRTRKSWLETLFARGVLACTVLLLAGLPSSGSAGTYYLLGEDPSDTSSLSGYGSCVGWGTAPGGSKVATAVEPGNVYVIPSGKTARTPSSSKDGSGKSYTFPGDQLVFEGGTVNLKHGGTSSGTYDFVVTNLQALGSSTTSAINCGNWKVTYNLKGTNWVIESGATLGLGLSADSGDPRTYNVQSTIVGDGTLRLFTNTGGAIKGNCNFNLSGDFSGFSGDIDIDGCYKTAITVSNPDSFGSDSATGPNRVTIDGVKNNNNSNGITLTFKCDYVSGPNRSWNFGSVSGATIPVFSVDSGKTVTIQGPIGGSAGLKKQGNGTLVFAHPNLAHYNGKTNFVGGATISADELSIMADIIEHWAPFEVGSCVWDGATLNCTLTRGVTLARAVYVAYGETDGGDTSGNWGHYGLLGSSFAAGATTLDAAVALPEGTKFVRFYNDIDGWSNTINLDEIGLVTDPQVRLAAFSIAGTTPASADASVTLLGLGYGAASADVFAVYSHDGVVATNRIAAGATQLAPIPFSFAGLKPATTYRLHLYATNGLEEGECRLPEEGELEFATLPEGMGDRRRTVHTGNWSDTYGGWSMSAPSEGNLILGKMPYRYEHKYLVGTADPDAAATDGLFPTSNSGEAPLFGVGDGCIAGWTFDAPSTITSVRFYSPNVGGRSRIMIERITAIVNGQETTISPQYFTSQEGQNFLKVSLDAPEGQALANDATAITVYFSASQNGGMYCSEIEAIGFESGFQAFLQAGDCFWDGRTLTTTLSRNGTAASDVYACFGASYGDDETNGWEHCEKAGSFTAGSLATSASATVPEGTLYVRFYSERDGWTESFYLPELAQKVSVTPAVFTGVGELGSTYVHLTATVSATGAGRDAVALWQAFGTNPDALPAPELVAENLAVGTSVSTNLYGLLPDTTYYWFVSARNGTEEGVTNVLTSFRTTRVKDVDDPSKVKEPILTLEQPSFTEPGLLALSYEVLWPGAGAMFSDVILEYGDTEKSMPYRATVASDVVGPRTGVVSGFLPGHAYYVRLVATNALGMVSAPTSTYRVDCPSLTEKPGEGRGISVVAPLDGDPFEASLVVADGETGGQTLLAFWGARFGGENTNAWDGSAVVAENLPATVCTNDWSRSLPADAEFLRFAVCDAATGTVSWSETYVRSLDGHPLIGSAAVSIADNGDVLMSWDFRSVGTPDDNAVLYVHYGTDAAAAEVTRNYGPARAGEGVDLFPSQLPGTTYYWYLELVTPSGSSDRSPVQMFQAPGGALINPSNPDTRNGREITFPFQCTEIGAGETWAILKVGYYSGSGLKDPSQQTLYEFDRMRIPSTGSYSFTWDGTEEVSTNGHSFAALAYGDLIFWQIIMSNELARADYRKTCYGCGTFRVCDFRTFTWAGTDGSAWDDPASWTPSSAEPSDAPGYPIWGSTAEFPASATVSVTADVTVGRIQVPNEAALAFTGPGSVLVSRAPWDSNMGKRTSSMSGGEWGIGAPNWVPEPTILLGTGSSVLLSEGTRLCEDSTSPNRALKSGQVFRVGTGSSYVSSKEVNLHDASSALVVDGGSVTVSGHVRPSATAAASDGITIGGAGASFVASNMFAVASASYATADVKFMVPAEGFLSIPLRTRAANPYLFAKNDKSDNGLIRISVPADAPAATEDVDGDYRLIEWSYAGIDTNWVVLAELPHPDTDYWFWTYDNSSATNGETVTGLGVHLVGGADEPTAPSIRKVRLTNCSETTADVEATVAPGGTSPTADFSYAVTAPGAAEPTAWTPLASAVAERTVLSIPLADLTRSTDYTVWLRGVNDAGTTVVPFAFATLGDFAVIGNRSGVTSERTYGPYSILTFSDPSKLANLEVIRGGQADILLVGGGGAGGKAKGYHGGGGGGGAGGFVYMTGTVLLPGSYTVQVGAGGDATTDAHMRSNGEPSRLLDASGTALFTALGGGGGGSGLARAGRDGGSGGGGVGLSAGTDGHELPGPGGQGTPGQGHNGGTNQVDPTESDAGGSGGGGAGEPGWNANGSDAGAGGSGLACSISGNTLYYAGGGAGGPRDGAVATGGLGGGADSRSRDYDGAPGVDGLGGGGAGGAGSMNGAAKNGGRGGCGTVILRVRTAPRGTCPYVAFRSVDANATDALVEFEILELGDGATGVNLSFVWGETEDDLRYTIPMGAFDAAKIDMRTVNGLRPNHRYYAKLVADNGLANGIGETEAFAFTTGPLEESGVDGRIIPGLWQGLISQNGIDTSTNIRLREVGPGDSQRRAELSPVAGKSAFAQNAYLPSTSYPDNPVKMMTKTTYAYVGFVYLPAGATYFMLNSDETASLSISGAGLAAPVSMSKTGSAAVFGVASVAAAGWFAIDVRLYNGSGSGCAVADGYLDASGKPVTVGYTSNANTYAFSIANLPLPEPWTNLADPGDGSFLRTDLPKRSVWVESTTVSASGLSGTVAFGNESSDSSALYMAYGPEWCGSDWQAWATSGQYVPLYTIESTTTSSAFGPVPNWGTANFYVRFCLKSENGGESWSDPVYYEDPAAPSIADFTLANVLGDTFTVVGNLATCGTGCDAAQVFVEYGHAADFSDAVRWDLGEIPQGSFRGRVFTNDVASAHYVVPGDTYYVRLVAVNDAGIWTSSEIRSFATAAGSKLSIDAPIVSQRNATLVGRLSEVGCGDTAIRFRWSTDDGATWQTRELDPVPAGTHPRNSEFAPMRITAENFGDTILWEFTSSNGCATASWTDTVSGSFTAKDTTVYKWKAADGSWDGDWSDVAHWTPSNADNTGYPHNPDATADFSDCPVGHPVTVSVTNSVNGGTIRSTMAGQDLTFVGDPGTELTVLWDLSGKGSAYAVEGLHVNASKSTTITLSQSVSIEIRPGAILSVGTFKTCTGAGSNRVDVLEGAEFRLAGSFSPQGRGSVVTLDNSTMTVAGEINGSGNVDSYVLFRGECPKLRVKGTICWLTSFVFDIPLDGYKEIPIEPTSTASFDSNNQRRNRFAIHPESKLFDSGRARSIPLMRWTSIHPAGAPEEHFIFEEAPYAANGVNRLHVYYDDDPETVEGRNFYGVSLTYKGNGGTSLFIR